MAEIGISFETVEEREGYLDLDVLKHNLIALFISKESPPIPDVSGGAVYAIEHSLHGKQPLALLRRGNKVVAFMENQFRTAPFREILHPGVEFNEETGGEVGITISNWKVPPLKPQRWSISNIS